MRKKNRKLLYQRAFLFIPLMILLMAINVKAAPGMIETDADDYAVGDQVSITVTDFGLDTDSGAVESMNVNIKSSVTDTTGISVQLNETGVDTGIFAGVFSIADVTDSGILPQQLGAAVGEQINIMYNDGSSDIFKDIAVGNSISGIITLPDGRSIPSGGFWVTIFARNDNGTPDNYTDDIAYTAQEHFAEGTNSLNYSIAVPVNNDTSRYTVSYSIPPADGLMSYGRYSIDGTKGITNEATALDVRTGNLSGIDIQLLPACTVSGTVSLPGIQVAPAGGIEVEMSVFYSIDNTSYGTIDKVTIAEGTNSVDYEVKVIPRNDYHACAIPAAGSDYMSANYSETIDCSGITVSNIDITLVDTRKISGTISLPSGRTAPAGGIPVHVNASNGIDTYGQLNLTIPEGDNSVEYTVKVPIDNTDDGYTINCSTNLGLGYMMYVFYSDSGTTTDYTSATLIDVSTSSVTGKNLEMVPGSTISGTVSLPGTDVAQEEMWIGVEATYNDGDTKVGKSWYYIINPGESSYDYSFTVPQHTGYQVTAKAEDIFTLDTYGYVGNYYTSTLDLSSTDASNINITLSKEPQLTVNDIPANTESSTITINGTITDNAAGIAITVNGVDQGAVVITDGAFSKTVNLDSGSNAISVNASNNNFGTGYSLSPVQLSITRNIPSNTGSNNTTPPAPSTNITPPEPEPEPESYIKFDESTGSTEVKLGEDDIEEALSNAVESESKTATLEIPEVEGSSSYTVEMPGSSLSSDDNTCEIILKTEIGDLQVPNCMLSTLELNEEDSIGLSMGTSDLSDMDDNTRNMIGDKPVIELNVLVNGKKTSWENANAPVTVSIPYIPSEEELADPEHIVVWYIDSNGTAVSVPNGKYDPDTGMVTFKTTHFSKYAVAFVKKTFNDLEQYKWAKKSIEVMASKGVISGKPDGLYDPGSPITRADFIKLLVKTLDLSAKVDTNFDDVKETDYFYKEVGIAKQLGIAKGSGENLFNPRDTITRQDMMVLIERALKIVNKLEANGSSTILEKYEDSDKISAYALDSVSSLIEEGVVKGSGEFINPLNEASRAECAVLIYRLYNK